ncbi:MAG TPA: PhoH family protein [Acholeplasmataceae bacterium]|nr:PhoH family protein [Acholeplasmataceae bacterium]
MSFKSIYRLRNALNEAKIAGPNNKYLYLIEDYFQEEILLRLAEIKIREDSKNEKLLTELFSMLEFILEHNNLTEIDLVTILNNFNGDNGEEIIDLYLNRNILITTASGKTIYPKTVNQKYYLNSLEKNDVIFAVGPAGTGKTYLGVLYAVSKLKAGEIRKIVLVRPVVEAGEKLGYLPGDLKEKIDPYLVPLYDSLNEALGKENVDRMIEKGIVEIAPLAYMRGRTIDGAIIILDEAQNSSQMQMKMFLTRLGYGSKMIITGDITQIDLPNRSSSGLIQALNILDNIKNIQICHFTRNDVMRHPLVQKIIERYENYGD